MIINILKCFFIGAATVLSVGCSSMTSSTLEIQPGPILAVNSSIVGINRVFEIITNSPINDIDKIVITHDRGVDVVDFEVVNGNITVSSHINYFADKTFLDFQLRSSSGDSQKYHYELSADGIDNIIF